MNIATEVDGLVVTATVSDLAKLATVGIDWGDGSTDGSATLTGGETSATMTHTYPAEGHYVIVATDGEDNTDYGLNLAVVDQDYAAAVANGRLVLRTDAPPLDGDRYTLAGVAAHS